LPLCDKIKLKKKLKSSVGFFIILRIFDVKKSVKVARFGGNFFFAAKNNVAGFLIFSPFL
jgi:hypothetical protein